MALSVSFEKTEGDPKQNKARVLIEEGVYQAVLVGAEAKLSRKGNPMILLGTTITGSETGAEVKYVGYKKNSYLNFVTERQQRESVATLKDLLGDSFSDVATEVGGKTNVDLDAAAKKLIVLLGTKLTLEISHSGEGDDKSDWANSLRLLQAAPSGF